MVNNVQLDLLVAILLGSGVDGVLRQSVEMELLHNILLAVARIAAANGDIAQIALHLEGVAVVLEREIVLLLVVEVDAVLTSLLLPVTHTLGLGGLDVDG